MRHLSADRLLLVAWLALVWVLLWGSLSPLVLMSSAVVAPVCLAACRLPVLPVTSRPRLSAVPGALLRFGRDLVTSSGEIAWSTLRRGPRTKSAVIAVPVAAASDVTLTVVAHRISLEPGTLVVDIDRNRNVLYVYVLDVYGTENVERARRNAERVADDVVHTLGAQAPGPRADAGKEEA